MGNGSFFQRAINIWYFGFSGLIFGGSEGTHKPIFIVQRLRLESPVRLEREGARPALAATEVEETATAFGGAPHDFPIHEIIGRRAACGGSSAGIVGQYFVAEIETQNTADYFVTAKHREDLAIFAKLLA